MVSTEILVIGNGKIKVAEELLQDRIDEIITLASLLGYTIIAGVNDTESKMADYIFPRREDIYLTLEKKSIGSKFRIGIFLSRELKVKRTSIERFHNSRRVSSLNFEISDCDDPMLRVLTYIKRAID